MRRFRLVFVGSVIAAGLLIPGGAAQAAASSPAPSPKLSVPTKHGNWTIDFRFSRSAGQSVFGCAYGHACLYTDSGASTNTPEHSYFTYGCKNLSNEFNHRYLVNNQYGGATVTLYLNYNCSGPTFTSQEAEVDDGSITPINSISLNP